MTLSNQIWSFKVALSRFRMCLEHFSENCQFFEGLFSSKNNHFAINFHVNSLISCRNILLSTFFAYLHPPFGSLSTKMSFFAIFSRVLSCIWWCLSLISFMRFKYAIFSCINLINMMLYCLISSFYWAILLLFSVFLTYICNILVILNIWWSYFVYINCKQDVFKQLYACLSMIVALFCRFWCIFMLIFHILMQYKSP
jgi:hypothetical protein